MSPEITVDVILDAERAQALLNPARLELLEHLEQPGSAASLARLLEQPRQRVNYHLRALEDHDLVELVEERRQGSVVERVYRRTGSSYAISSATLGRLGITPEDVQDRFSSAYQIALASRAVRDLGELQVAARAADKQLPTFGLEVEVRFASAERRNAFAEELAEAVAQLVSRYHDDCSGSGRTFRFYLGAYPKPADLEEG